MQDRTKRLLLGSACIVAGILLYRYTRPQPRVAAPADVPSAAQTPRASAPPQIATTPHDGRPTEPPAPSVPAETAGHPPVVALVLPAPNSPPSVDPDGPPPTSEPVAALPADPAQDLEGVQTMMRDFRTALGGNPVGTNAEITSALLGDNLNQVKLSIPLGSSVNENGELVDRWGTPYFFHQLSAKEMEIRSAGPDRKMWTGDDRQVK